ncbi:MULTISPECIES: phosphoenolpyruvate carboxykinase (GTP) [Actinomycetes]|uniref:Phosphoenolpyruvate carboxykinase [GTP] n=1 Tax=Brevibacterium ravenspurgense TaxID=479117 RepID=A0A2I1IHK4_9MICO|nr:MULTISPECIES: phosphoenolpyruvate carboxykinase (GTP) [Actinomycetes]MCM3908233.1 phosphoenolpyruvate carboxykinase (GTP) [Trueperella bernardiae]MDK7181523.1 phosphoenolpyruvate carboxykinase (GTP) [Corynebacterium riegelii]MDK7749874.1 phosphoenolpyruvate carboxykinase (GTP) [Brevibacterium sp. UMB10442]OFT42913.1 phosphoenolpyruvate carboxykinase [Arthrobacter sp. HMSC06H05]PKY70606.1 phosphoenolpyruvate carboxykinase (GTP) [Brevibacterium ravenspurgense]
MTASKQFQVPPEIHVESVRAFVSEWAEITNPEKIELVSAADDARLLEEAIAAGEMLRAGKGRYYSRSHPKDTARTEERTFVATADEADRGRYNNWRHSSEVKPLLTSRMRGASAGKTMYVVPYLMAPPGTPLANFALGVELTDDRNVVLQMIRMARVGIEHFDGVSDQDFFVRGVHVTGDLTALQQGTDADERMFVTVADERTILHFGSAYGGNALLGKIAHGLRQASYDGYASGKFLAEQFLLLGIHDRETGVTTHVCGGFPSASGKTNLAMTLPPNGLGDRYRVDFYGDDIAWMWVDDEGKLRAINPENGAFGVAKDTNEGSNPTAMAAIAEGSGTIFTNTAYNEVTGEVWWEGLTPEPPADPAGWLDWTGAKITDRTAEQQNEPWAHPNSRFTIPLERIPNLAEDVSKPEGVVVDAIIFGGRTRDREPLIRAIDNLVDGVYDGLTLGAEATFAADGLDGQLRYDPMSMRPFFSYSEGRYAEHWLKVLGQLKEMPMFAHVNWFQREPETGRYLWPGFRENLRALNWLTQYRDGKVKGRKTPIGVLPLVEELDFTGLEIDAADLDKLLRVDVERWLQETDHRAEHLRELPDMPREIWDAHEALVEALRAEAATDAGGADS